MPDKFNTEKHSSVACPECGSVLTNVTDVLHSLKTDFDCAATRRRILCLMCDYRFTTYEITKRDFKRVLRKKNILTEKRMRDFIRDMTRLVNSNTSGV